MNGELALIFFFVLAALWIIFRRPGRSRPSLREADQRPEGDSEFVNSELLDQLARLEERVKVLERILTDDPRDLRRQFRELADRE